MSTALRDALNVLIRTPATMAYLEANDPQALKQARMALATRVVHGQDAMINGHYCYFGSVAGYAGQVWDSNANNVHESVRAYNKGLTRTEAMSRAIERALDNRERMYWINRHAIVITNSDAANRRMKAERDVAIKLGTGDYVMFEGNLFEIAHDHNDNFKLAEVV